MGLIVDTTTRCNMACAHCMWSRTLEGADMTDDVFLAALSMDPVRGRGTFSFGSGEATVHPRFFELLDMAIADGRWRVRVVTNGRRTSHALRLAELAREGIIEAHLSLDKWHDPIDQSVIDAFKRDPTNKKDRRAYRFCDDEDLKNAGRCDFAADKRPTCRCPVPRVTVDGTVYMCGCETAVSLGNVMTGWDRSLLANREQLGCMRYLTGANGDAHNDLFRSLNKIHLRGVDR